MSQLTSKTLKGFLSMSMDRNSSLCLEKAGRTHVQQNTVCGRKQLPEAGRCEVPAKIRSLGENKAMSTFPPKVSMANPGGVPPDVSLKNR